MLYATMPSYIKSTSFNKNTPKQYRYELNKTLLFGAKSLGATNVLFKEYTNATLTELSEQENKCYSKKNILQDHCADCNALTEERLRQTVAYGFYNDNKPGTVTSDKDTYDTIGVPKVIQQTPSTLTTGKACLTATLCSPTTETSVLKKHQTKQIHLESNEYQKNQLYDILIKAKLGEKALLDL